MKCLCTAKHPNNKMRLPTLVCCDGGSLCHHALLEVSGRAAAFFSSHSAYATKSQESHRIATMLVKQASHWFANSDFSCCVDAAQCTSVTHHLLFSFSMSPPICLFDVNNTKSQCTVFKQNPSAFYMLSSNKAFLVAFPFPAYGDI